MIDDLSHVGMWLCVCVRVYIFFRLVVCLSVSLSLCFSVCLGVYLCVCVRGKGLLTKTRPFFCLHLGARPCASHPAEPRGWGRSTRAPTIAALVQQPKEQLCTSQFRSMGCTKPIERSGRHHHHHHHHRIIIITSTIIITTVIINILVVVIIVHLQV